MSDEKRVILVKPGDVLLIGNVGQLPLLDLAVIQQSFEGLGIEVLTFEADITVDVKPGRAEPDPSWHKPSEVRDGSGRKRQLAHDAAPEGVEVKDRPAHQAP